MTKLTLHSFQRKEVSKVLHLFSLYLIVIGLVCSKAMMSIGMIVGGFSVLIDPELNNHIKKWVSNKFIVLLFLFLLLHLISFIWSSNLVYALSDLKTKVSLLVIPLIIVSKPLANSKVKETVLISFLAALFVTSFINITCYYQLFGARNYEDIRGLSLFGSHIRYTVLIAFGFILCVEKLVNKKRGFPLYIILMFWFCFYLFFSQVMSAYIAFFLGLVTYFSFFFILNKKIKGFLILISSFFLFFIFMFAFLVYPENKTDLEINEIELIEAWNDRSEISFDQKDHKNQNIKQTVIRYLHSKSLPANAIGVNQLTVKDIQNIENGVADYRELNSGILSRLYAIRFEFHHSVDPNGHSLLQRVEYWKSGISIFKRNWLFGVGSGDVQDAFNQEYINSNSKLHKENRKRAHNTFLTTGLSLGLFGLVLFLYILYCFIKRQCLTNQIQGLVFIVIAISTFFIEDTLETQTGITFFAFYYAWFIVEDLTFESS